MWLDNIVFEKRVIEDERLDLSDKDGNYYLGPELLLRRCTLVLKVPAKRLHLVGTRLIDCSVEVKKELKGLAWNKTQLKGCRVTGRLIGCDFGYWPVPEVPYTEMGGIEDCDFSDAQLDACRFIGCDARTLRFPSWPYFTLLDPYRRSRELDDIQWPGRLNVVLHGFSELPEKTAAVTYSATSLAERYGTTEDAIWAVLQRLDGTKH
ncbi:hypothetical protein [Hyalangium rubrum]|uniref:Uncharacterized protein n=1 Tax=Hyalangium rubrum TaxID=3103134 RepID=A0ABU5GYZ1_9BACT|nr:hypothetical protein [Hyalangium sp. s54d21]MDY7226398.1 hypothetical protein [Hyalangium sp. s54d21]